MATAPAHVEDRLDDAWLQFAEDDHSDKQQHVDSIMASSASNGICHQAPLAMMDVEDTMKISREAKTNGIEKYLKEEEPFSVPKESRHNVAAWHNVPHP